LDKKYYKAICVPYFIILSRSEIITWKQELTWCANMETGF